MKTTVDIADGLFAEARALAKAEDVTLRELIESGLRKELRDRKHRGKPAHWKHEPYGDPAATTWLKPPYTEDDWGRIREDANDRDPDE